jgi:hypothetical protein
MQQDNTDMAVLVGTGGFGSLLPCYFSCSFSVAADLALALANIIKLN